jgi:FtsZ-binding cell division protein ZapB
LEEEAHEMPVVDGTLLAPQLNANDAVNDKGFYPYLPPLNPNDYPNQQDFDNACKVHSQTSQARDSANKMVVEEQKVWREKREKCMALLHARISQPLFSKLPPNIKSNPFSILAELDEAYAAIAPSAAGIHETAWKTLQYKPKLGGLVDLEHRMSIKEDAMVLIGMVKTPIEKKIQFINIIQAHPMCEEIFGSVAFRLKEGKVRIHESREDLLTQLTITETAYFADKAEEISTKTYAGNESSSNVKEGASDAETLLQAELKSLKAQVASLQQESAKWKSLAEERQAKRTETETASNTARNAAPSRSQALQPPVAEAAPGRGNIPMDVNRRIYFDNNQRVVRVTDANYRDDMEAARDMFYSH